MGPARSAQGMTRFFAFACLWSWAFWIPMVLFFQNRGPEAGGTELAGIPIWALLLAFVGGYGPTAAGQIFSARESGRDGVKALLRRLVVYGPQKLTRGEVPTP